MPNRPTQMTGLRASSSVAANVAWGSKGGVAIAAVLSVWATAVRLFGGDTAFNQIGVPYIVVIATYLVGGAIAGAIVGLLRPLAMRPWGAPIVGIVAAVPISAAVVFQTKAGRWETGETLTLAISSVALGALGGAGLYGVFREP